MKPKARYKTKKIRLDVIMQNKNIDKYFIETYISNAHDVAFHSSHFIRAYVLFLYENNKSIPIINYQFFKLCCLVLTKKSSRGSVHKGENKNTIEKLQKFYDKHYSKLGYKIDDKINSLHLSQMLEYIGVEYETSVNNNIILNFFNYVKRYINSSFITKIKKEAENETKDNYSEFKNLENEYLNSICSIIVELVNNINSLLKNKFSGHDKNEIQKIHKKEFIFLVKNKQKYVNKYKKICKTLKIMPA